MQLKPENNPYFTATYEELFVAARLATVSLFNGVEVLVIEPALARALRHLSLYAPARWTPATPKLSAQLTQAATTVWN